MKRLPSYELRDSGTLYAPWIQAIAKDTLDTETLEKLELYTRGEYDEELHYQSFWNYKRTINAERRLYNRLKRDRLIETCLWDVKEALKELECQQYYRNYLPFVDFKPSTAAGYGYIGSKIENHSLAVSNAYKAIRDFHFYRNEYTFVPFKAFARSQLALRANPKIRHIWAPPFHTIFIESLMAEPLIKQYTLRESPFYIGKDMFASMPADISKAFHEPDVHVYCIDLSCFDANVNTWFKEQAFDIIFGLVKIIDETSADYVRQCFMKTPIIMPDGKLYYSTTGVPSGSMFTQLVDSIVNLLYILSSAIIVGHDVPNARTRRRQRLRRTGTSCNETSN